MIARASFYSIHWMLLAVLALAPAAVFAQQDNASRGQSPQDQDQSKAAPAKTQEPSAKMEAPPAQTEAPQAQTEKDPKVISGMSILGNQEAPKALVIIPWKRSELGNALGISTMLDDSRLPIDKEVFMRMLSYYEIRSEPAHLGGAATNGSAAAPANAAQRRNP